MLQNIYWQYFRSTNDLPRCVTSFTEEGHLLIENIVNIFFVTSLKYWQHFRSVCITGEYTLRNENFVNIFFVTSLSVSLHNLLDFYIYIYIYILLSFLHTNFFIYILLIIFYPTLVLFEQTNCIDWILICYMSLSLNKILSRTFLVADNWWGLSERRVVCTKIEIYGFKKIIISIKRFLFYWHNYCWIAF